VTIKKERGQAFEDLCIRDGGLWVVNQIGEGISHH
jgi:hypothetical protein